MKAVPVSVHPSVPDVAVQRADGLPEVHKGGVGVLAVQHGQRGPRQDGEHRQPVPTQQNSYVQCFGSVLDAFSMASWNRICTQHTDPGTGTGYRYIIIYKIIEVGVKKTNHSLVMNIM